MAPDTWPADRAAAVAWARDLLSRKDWCILDTETTGLGDDAEIVQVGVLAPSGRVLLDCLVRPGCSIPPEATAVHGITDADVADAPPLICVWAVLYSILCGSTAVIYNAAYDWPLMYAALKRADVYCPQALCRVECAMLQYAAWFGERSPKGGYRWQKLEGGDHTAIGDCRATLALIQRMAEDRHPCDEPTHTNAQ